MKPALLVLLSLIGGASCAAPPPASPGRSPLALDADRGPPEAAISRDAARPPGADPRQGRAWRLVEAPSPGGPELVLESYDPTGSVRISIRFAQERAAVGEVVEAEVRLPEATGPHRIEVVPDRPGVVILGPREFWMEGASPRTVRFTCTAPGRGGITVLVKE